MPTGRQARNLLSAPEKAAHTARWATTMTRWLVSKSGAMRKWRIVSFVGPQGAESRGIVDLIAIRKDHRFPPDGFKRGDLFEIILIQVKGGKAAWPSLDDIARLRAVAEIYRAKAVLLAEWRKGSQPNFYQLRAARLRRGTISNVWIEVSSPAELFA